MLQQIFDSKSLLFWPFKNIHTFPEVVGFGLMIRYFDFDIALDKFCWNPSTINFFRLPETFFSILN